MEPEALPEPQQRSTPRGAILNNAHNCKRNSREEKELLVARQNPMEKDTHTSTGGGGTGPGLRVGHGVANDARDELQPVEIATLFGVDVSEHQNGMNLGEAAAEAGLDFAIIRTTDGTHQDVVYRSHIADAESSNLITAAYHYLRNPGEGSSIAEQVQASLEVMGELRRPVWIDVETPAGLHVEHIRECKRLFEQAGVRVVGCYSYVPYWERNILPSEPDSHEFGSFWVAAYGSNEPGPAREIYPGNEHRQWAYPLGGQLPSLWQYSSQARFRTWQDGAAGVDINAFRGTREQLVSLFYGESEAVASPEKGNRLEKMTRRFLGQFIGR